MNTKSTFLFIMGTTLMLATLLAVPSSKRATAEARTNNPPSLNVGYWENLFMIGHIEIDGKERHFISQIFKACYPEYSRGRFEEGFNEVMRRYCGSTTNCRVVYTSEVASSDEEQVKKYHKDWASNSYQEIYYIEPESIYYRSCK